MGFEVGIQDFTFGLVIRSSGYRAEEALHNNVCNCKKAVSTLVPVHLF